MTYFVAPTCVILQRSRILLGQPQCGTNFLFRCYEFATTSGGVVMKSLVVMRSIVVSGHKTSVTLEDAFWRGIKENASGRNITLSNLITAVDSERQQGNLSSAIRLFVLDFYRSQLADVKDGPDDAEGHLKSGAVMQSEYHAPQIRRDHEQDAASK